MASMAELRAIAKGTILVNESADNRKVMVLTEQHIRDLFLDEAYQGRDQIKPIADLMDKIEQMIRKDPMVQLTDSPEGKEMDRRLCEVFGFKDAHIMWIRDPYMMNGGGPCTIMASRMITSKTAHLAHGNFTNGLYDSKHTMSVVVVMPTAIVEACDFTGPEMTAVLLHELGHNFDYTPFSIMYAYVEAIILILQVITNPTVDNITVAITQAAVSHSAIARRVLIEFMNLGEVIGRIIPPIGVVLYGVGMARRGIMKLLNYLLTPVGYVLTLPTYILRMPFSWIANFFTRKKETYADSVATMYGYGPELIFALEKLNVGMGTFNKAPKGLLTVPDNLVLCYQELISLAIGGHRTSQQRNLSAIDAIKRELQSPGVDTKTKKACEKELARLEDTYNTIVNLNDDKRMFLTKLVRQLVDQWYAGTSPNFMNIVDPENTYMK